MHYLDEATGGSRGGRWRWWGLLLLVVLAVSCGCTPENGGPPPIEPTVFQVEWERTFGGGGRSCGYGVQEAGDGGFIITGQAESEGDGGQLYLLKVDREGNREWERYFGGPGRALGYYAQPTKDGGYIVGGQITAERESDGYLVKTDSQGEEEWEGSFGGREDDNILYVAPVSDGGYIACGWSESFNSRRELYLLKVNREGKREWESHFCRGSRSSGSHVLETADGGFLVTGTVDRSGESGYGERDIYLVKVDGEGKLEWEEILGGSSDEEGFFAQPEGERGYVAAGQSFSYSTGTTSVYLVGLDEEGEPRWEKNIESNDSYLGLSVHPALEGGYLILGQVMDAESYRGISLAKADHQGKKEWVLYLGGGRNCSGQWALQVDAESYLVVGWIEEEGNGERELYLAKIQP